MSDLHPTPRATRTQYHVTHRVTDSGVHTLCGGFIPFTDNGHTAAIRGTAAKTDRTACKACEWMKYDVEPLTVTALLEAADEVLYRREVYRRLNDDLARRGVDFNRLYIIGEVVDYFARLRMVPRPESALPIFLGLEGEAALSEIITRNQRPWGEL